MGLFFTYSSFAPPTPCAIEPRHLPPMSSQLERGLAEAVPISLPEQKSGGWRSAISQVT